MKVLMDADCLIKLTKSKLKELVCKNFSVSVPQVVKEEVVDNAEKHPDALIIKKNIESKLLTLNKMSLSAQKGEDALFATFQHGKFGAICSDDKRFLKRLQLFDIPYITPSVFINILLKDGEIILEEAYEKLDLLSPFISDDEYNAVKLVLEKWRMQ